MFRNILLRNTKWGSNIHHPSSGHHRGSYNNIYYINSNSDYIVIMEANTSYFQENGKVQPSSIFPVNKPFLNHTLWNWSEWFVHTIIFIFESDPRNGDQGPILFCWPDSKNPAMNMPIWTWSSIRDQRNDKVAPLYLKAPQTHLELIIIEKEQSM